MLQKIGLKIKIIRLKIWEIGCPAVILPYVFATKGGQIR